MEEQRRRSSGRDRRGDQYYRYDTSRRYSESRRPQPARRRRKRRRRLKRSVVRKLYLFGFLVILILFLLGRKALKKGSDDAGASDNTISSEVVVPEETIPQDEGEENGMAESSAEESETAVIPSETEMTEEPSEIPESEDVDQTVEAVAKRDPSTVSSQAISLEQYKDSHFMISHALGGINDTAYLNCLEGFQENYEEGHRIFEVDMSYTSDDKIVLWHDWGKSFNSRYADKYVPTYKEFMGCKLKGKYTPMSLERLLELMAEYPDILVITDSKSNKADSAREQFTMIVDTAKNLGMEPVLGRFCVQVYNEEMYEAVDEVYHFPSYIFTVYKYFNKAPSAAKIEKVYEYCEKNHISMVTMRSAWWKKSFAAIAKKHGVATAVHTINGSKSAQKYFDQGVNGIYTDFLAPVAESTESAEEE